jgi:arabinogalactan endo-1,4-beta-galactosidase
MFRVSISLLSLALAALFAGEASASAARRFVAGADISALATLEARGAHYRGAKGRADALSVLRDAGLNCFRLRLFVAPNGEGIVTNDLDYTLALARRVRKTGAAFMLDLHYSDTWADPAKQFKPAAWAGLPFEKLEAAVREYTRRTLERFIAEGLAPEFVQIGNEITNGLLWPEGRVEFADADNAAAWSRLARLLRAGIEGLDAAVTNTGAQRPQVIFHIESTGDPARTRWWLREAQRASLAYDIVGFSFYPEWHGGLAGLRETLEMAATEFKKPVMVVETAYPWGNDEHWSGKKNLDWPLTPEGQRQFISDVVETVRALPDGRGAGVFWWHPESIQIEGAHAWNGGSCALFDDHGAVLPAAAALGRSARP